jgi:hypothetical protein
VHLRSSVNSAGRLSGKSVTTVVSPSAISNTAGANDVPVTLAAIPVKVVEPGASRERQEPRVRRG